MSLLEIKKLHYSIDDNGSKMNIIDDISLSVGLGKLVVLTGPNGGGKTSLAKLIMGIAQPTAGSILLDGQDISALDVYSRARLGISYAFQQPTRIKGITVNELLSMAVGKEVAPEECCRYLTSVGLCSGDYLNRALDSSLSGGEMKRIEIASILARHSKINIFDEPEAGIDLWSFAQLTETFKRMHEKRDSAIIIISHQERILELADEIIVISDGKIQQQGSKDEIFPKIMGEVQFSCNYIRDMNAEARI
ncbi:MAG: ATP-binding cassette domain-containing protein [Deferribacteraceae bacterium]|jgi:Fe-S cluster assembly ATP-binding protein|nr:ATP-binding cassette domain-containing protein [Deferribacteraceae bacterium]